MSGDLSVLNREKFIAEMPLREGANAIYIERPLIVYVRVSEIRCFDDHMEARITIVPTSGMNQVGRPSFKVGGAWQGFSNIHDKWHVQYVAWSLYFGKEEVRIGLELAARAAERGSVVTLREMRTPLEDCHSRRPDSSVPPKP